MEDAPGLPPSLGFSSPPLSARHILEQVVAAHSPLLASDAIPAALGVSDDTYQLDYQATEAEFIADYLEGLHRAPSFSNSELGLHGIASIQLGAGPNPPLPPSPLPSRPSSEASVRSEKAEDLETDSPPEVPPMPARRVRSYSNSVDGDAWHTEESFSPKNAALRRNKTMKSPPQLSLTERSTAGGSGRMSSIDLSNMQRGDSFTFNPSPDGSPEPKLRTAIDRSSSHGSTGSRNSFEISTPTSPIRYATNSSLRVPSNATDSSGGSSYQSSSASSLAVSINATPRTSLTSGRTGIHSPISPSMGSTSIRITTTNTNRNSNPTLQSSPPNHTRGDSGSSSARGFIKPHSESSFVEMLLSNNLPNDGIHSNSPLSARSNHKSGSLSDLRIPDSDSVPKPPLSCETSPTDLDVAQLQRLGSPKHHLLSEQSAAAAAGTAPGATTQFNISSRGTSVFETGFNAIMSSASHSPPTVPSTSIYQSSNSPLQVPQSPSHSSPMQGPNSTNTFRLKLLRKPSMTESIGSPTNSSSGVSPTNVSAPKPPTAPFGFSNMSPVNIPQASPMPSPMQPAASLLTLAVNSTSSSTSTASATSSAGNSYMLASSSAPNSASGSDPNYSPDSATFVRDANQPAPPPLSPLMTSVPSPSNASGSLLKGRAGRKINVVFGNKPSSQTQESPAIQPQSAAPLPGDEFSSL